MICCCIPQNCGSRRTLHQLREKPPSPGRLIWLNCLKSGTVLLSPSVVVRENVPVSPLSYCLIQICCSLTNLPSGLDPGTERNLMQSLAKMADGGKTVILVTHSTLQLKMCDKIVFMGKGGNLCFFGSYAEALTFFGVSDIVDVYNMITETRQTVECKI